MNNAHFSQSGIRTFLAIFIILGLCTTALIGLSASDHAVQMDTLNSSLISTVILATGPTSAEIKKQSSKTLKKGSKGEAVEEDTEMEIAKPNEPDESRAAFMKLGDIKGEATDAESRVPAHTPEWTNPNESDPGVAGNSQDAKHKEWIDVLSTSSAASKDEKAKAAVKAFQKKNKLDTDGVVDSNAVEREMKESGEKGGTTDMNIGLGELQEATSKSRSRKMLLRKKPGRTTYQGTTDNFKLTQPPIGYVCEGGGANDECFCEGVLDCNKLWLSSDCKKDTEWQDGNDPSKGGCTAAD